MTEGYRELLRLRGVGAEATEKLVVYLELLERWNRTHNLVSFRSREELADRHVVESLAGSALLVEDEGLLVDVGSGAGLPGVPLLTVKPGWRGVLIEPRRKRWAFLCTVIRELGLRAEAVECRYREAPVGMAAATAVVSRAMGGYGELLEWAGPRLVPGGSVVLWVGEEEASRLGRIPGWRVVTSALPGLEKGRLASCRPCST